jgi:tRNA(adenine34) deaminase
VVCSRPCRKSLLGGKQWNTDPPEKLSVAHTLGSMTDAAAGDAHERLMALAIERARAAGEHGDVPIGAVVARGGEPLVAAGNERELRRDPTAHAEILAIRAAAEALGGWRLPGTTLYVTLEPCAMCAGAIVLARIPGVVYGAPDPKAGAAGGVLDVLAEPALNHHPEVIGGVLEAECAALLRDFFASKRSGEGQSGEGGIRTHEAG